MSTSSLTFLRRTALSATLALALAACGGGGSSAPPIAGPAPGPTPPATPAPTACDVSEQIAFADDVLNDWYLFPDLLDNTVNQANFNTVRAMCIDQTAIDMKCVV